MKGSLLIGVAVLGLTQILLGQKATVLEISNAKYSNGARIKFGKPLKAGNRIEIKEGGHLAVNFGRLLFRLEKGVYPVDSVLLGFKGSREYLIDDSVYTFLKSANLLKCESIVKRGNLLISSNYKPEDNYVKTLSDTVTLKWNTEQRPDYKGGFYIILESMFSEYLDLKHSETNKLLINLKPIKNDYLLYRVISADCIEYDYKVIKRK